MSLEKNSPFYGRFKDLPWFKPMSESRIMICGAGGIGSHLAFMLSRAGAEIILVDNDTVDETNLAGQLFGREDIGKTKVQAVSDVVDRLCGENKINPLETFMDESGGQWADLLPTCDVVCVVFDNIKARKLVYETWTDNFKSPSLFMDGRMSAENGQVFAFPSDVDHFNSIPEYKDHFFDDALVPEQPCTSKATTHCGSMLASIMVAQINNWLSNIPYPGLRTVARKVEFHLPVSLFTVQNKSDEVPEIEDITADEEVLEYDS